jgi:hypothetical protein
VSQLRIAFFPGEGNNTESDSGVRVSTDGESICVSIGGEEHELSREAARELQDAIGDAMTYKREFLHTAGEHREDGKYVVSRRSADSAGNTKVFDDFDQMRRLYTRLPEEFGADEVSRTGITGSRRHMLVRHFAEHPAFDCTIARRNPLTVEKAEPSPEPEGEPESATAD